MEEPILNNSNFRKFEANAVRIDLLVHNIERKIVQFKNNPYGNPRQVLYFLEEANKALDLLED